MSEEEDAGHARQRGAMIAQLSEADRGPPPTPKTVGGDAARRATWDDGTTSTDACRMLECALGIVARIDFNAEARTTGVPVRGSRRGSTRCAPRGLQF